MKYLREHGKDRKYCHFELFSKDFLRKYGKYIPEEINGETDGQKNVWLLFDYEKRNPLTYSAYCCIVDLDPYKKTEKREYYDEKNKRNS